MISIKPKHGTAASTQSSSTKELAVTLPSKVDCDFLEACLGRQDRAKVISEQKGTYGDAALARAKKIADSQGTVS